MDYYTLMLNIIGMSIGGIIGILIIYYLIQLIGPRLFKRTAH